MAVNPLPSLPFLEINAPAVENWAHTQTKMYKVNFTWTLSNFSFLQQNETYESPIFSGGPNDEVKWSLCLLPGTDITIHIKLISEPNNKSKVLGKFKLSIMNDQNQKTNENKITEPRVFQISQTGMININLIKRQTLLDQASALLPEDTLTIFYEVDFVTDKVNFSGRKSIEGFQVPECSLGDDFGSLLDNRKFSDVTLVVGKHEFPAHKAILAARSDVFAAMFEHEMKESKLNLVTITDIDHEVFREMLRFIYMGVAPKLNEMADQLLAAADKYELIKLRVMCEEALFAELSIETAAETLHLADLHSATQLKEKIKIFFKIHAKDILYTTGWQKLTKIQSPVISEVLEAIFKPTK